MSSPPASATTILAMIQDARLRIRTLSHQHLPVAASLRIARAGALPDPGAPAAAPPTVTLLRVEILRQLRESGAIDQLEAGTSRPLAGLQPPAGQAAAPSGATQEADEEATRQVEADGALLAAIGAGAAAAALAASAPEDEATRVESGSPELLAALGADDAHQLGGAPEDGAPEDGAPEDGSPATSTTVQHLSFSQDHGAPSDDADDEATRVGVATPELIAALAAEQDEDSEATRVETGSPELLAALAADDGAAEDGVAQIVFEDDDDLGEGEAEEEATRISRIPPEVLRTIAERRAREESTSAPVLTVDDPGALDSAPTGEIRFTDDGPVEASSGGASLVRFSDDDFSDGDALFGDDDDGFSSGGELEAASDEDFPEWDGSGGAEADFEVVFDDGVEDEADPGAAVFEGDSLPMGDDEEIPEMEEWDPSTPTSFTASDDGSEAAEDDVAWPEDDDTLLPVGDEESAPPAVSLGAPRAVSPGIRIGGADPDQPTSGAAIQILGYGKARTLTPTLALGAAPGDEDDDEDELILDGEQPKLSVAFEEPDEELSGRHVPTLTEEPSGATAVVIGPDGAMSAEAAPPTDLDAGDARRFLDQARAAEQAGRLREAVVHYDDLLGHDPHSLDAHLGRGRCLVDLGDFSAAMSDFTRAEDIAPDSAEPIVEMGNLFFARKEWKKAISYFDHALGLDADHTMALCRRGICHYHRKRFDSAAEDLQAAKKLGAEVPGLDRYIRMATKRSKSRRR
jgi:hypothetical protein